MTTSTEANPALDGRVRLTDSAGEIYDGATAAKQDTLADAAQLQAGTNIAAGAIGTANAGDDASAVVLAAAATRERVVITNLSAVRIDIAVGTAAVAGRGIPLAGTADAAVAPGGSLVLTGGAAKLAINSIGTGAANALAYQTLSTS